MRRYGVRTDRSLRKYVRFGRLRFILRKRFAGKYERRIAVLAKQPRICLTVYISVLFNKDIIPGVQFPLRPLQFLVRTALRLHIQNSAEFIADADHAADTHVGVFRKWRDLLFYKLLAYAHIQFAVHSRIAHRTDIEHRGGLRIFRFLRRRFGGYIYPLRQGSDGGVYCRGQIPAVRLYRDSLRAIQSRFLCKRAEYHLGVTDKIVVDLESVFRLTRAKPFDIAYIRKVGFPFLKKQYIRNRFGVRRLPECRIRQTNGTE